MLQGFVLAEQLTTISNILGMPHKPQLMEQLSINHLISLKENFFSDEFVLDAKKINALLVKWERAPCECCLATFSWANLLALAFVGLFYFDMEILEGKVGLPSIYFFYLFVGQRGDEITGTLLCGLCCKFGQQMGFDFTTP